MEPDLVPFGNVLQCDRGELAVGHANNGPIRRANPRGAQPNMRNRAGTVTKAADVANQNRAISDYRNSSEQVLDRFLRGQRNREATHPKSRENGGCIVAPYAEDAENCEKEY